jgi:hypothetical protein
MSYYVSSPCNEKTPDGHCITDVPPDYICKVCDFCGLRSDSELANRRNPAWIARPFKDLTRGRHTRNYCSTACQRKDCARITGVIHCESRATGIAESRCPWCDVVT